jgi:hypothetical protein
MAVVKCARCNAVVTARLAGAELDVSHGESFLSSCPEIKSRIAAGQACIAVECSSMEIAVRRFANRASASRAWRLRKKAAGAVAEPPVLGELVTSAV